ncbi:hypothetical protein [Emticicia sp.]|uniref:hypothetical protein n=1 Tax=Emticicia sp. TaxID=1930953 RepID=UPI00375284BC
MKKIILFLIVFAVTTNVFAQSTLITPGNQENKNSAPDLILTSNGIPELRGQRSAGTLVAPTATTFGSNLLQLNGHGYTGSGYALGAQVRFYTTETWSSTARGTDIHFTSTKNGTTLATEKMRLTGDGYLGVGTTSPLTTLNVAGGNWDLATTNGDFAIGNSTYKLKFGVATGGGGAGDARIYTTGGTHRTIFGSNNIDIMTVTPTGVGVGTITPSTGFQIAGTTNNQTELSLIAQNSNLTALSFNRSSGTLAAPTATASAYNLGWINFNGYNGTSFQTSSSIRSLTTEAWTSTGRGSYLSFHTTNVGTTAMTERLRIGDGGNVGIGTTIPTGKLHIEHNGTDADPHLRIHSTGLYSRINWTTNTNANTWIAQSYLESATAASNYWRLEYGGSPRLYIAGDGNVGIGTSTPDNKLDVLGIIRANEVIVETGWADYVFQDNYKLKPLSEVEAFIKENKHLPSVPSAAKIQEKGAHVAELMTKMMEKIEELTLYSIEQKKEIEEFKRYSIEQKKEVDELKRRLDEKK